MIIDYIKESKNIEDEIIENRRLIHQNPEIGDDLPKTTSLVIRKLKEMGYEPKEICKGGIVAIVGDESKGKVILLRADMDALPMQEISNLEFKSLENKAHTCGHDTHTAMLLGAAKLLKINEDKLNGCVKLMFQPDEERLRGALNMIEAGVLENPKVDKAIAIHSFSGMMEPGKIAYKPNQITASSDRLQINIKGNGGHSSMPHKTVDPVNIASHICIALQSIVSREIDPESAVVISIGCIKAGTTGNIIPQEAFIECSVRAQSKETREFVLQRIEDIATMTAKSFRGEATIKNVMSTIPLVCNQNILDESLDCLSSILEKEDFIKLEKALMGSEDFAYISDKVPSIYLGLSMGEKNEGIEYLVHNPRVIFNEEYLYKGCAIYTCCAMEMLNK